MNSCLYFSISGNLFASAAHTPFLHMQALPTHAQPVRGTIVVASTVAVPLPATEEGQYDILMRFVESDDHFAIMEMTRLGCNIVDHPRKCCFSVALWGEVRGLHELERPDRMRLTGANMLHYALCIGSFDAAASLLVVCPRLLREQCNVSMLQDVSTVNTQDGITSVATEQKVLWVKTWSAIHITSFFCGLYHRTETVTEQDEANVQETLQQYKIAHAIVDRCHNSSAYSMLFGYGSKEQRIASALRESPAFMYQLLLRHFYMEVVNVNLSEGEAGLKCME